jgi:PTS system ascorbate-specific IIB component
MRIYCVCGAGVGTSVILARSAGKILAELGIEAEVRAVALAQLPSQPPSQLILSTPDVAAQLHGKGSEVVVLNSALDQVELRKALVRALS